MKENIRSFGSKVNYSVQIVAVGSLTGAFAGVVVTLYNIVAEMCERFSVGYYDVFRTHPAFIPLLFLALFLGSIVIGGVLKFLPSIRGSGFPQTEGATKGLIRFKWYRELVGMFAASLFVIFMGLSAGYEGQSLMIGGACGYGVSDTLRRNPIVRRYQITGGACAGLAVALNAPLTGMIFAYEEAHKRFTPEVFVCSFSSVTVAIVVRNLLRPALGYDVGPFLSNFEFAVDAGMPFCLYALAAALVVSFVGIGFYFLLFRFRKFFARIMFLKGYGKYALPFLLAGVCGLITPLVMGGGLEFIELLGSQSEVQLSLFGFPLWAVLLAVIALKFLVTIVNTGADLPCCSSVPMLAMGAGIGALSCLLFEKLGMDPALSDGLVVLCMVTFFATVVKAPMTGIIMAVELTWSFTFLLPAVICVAVGYLVGNTFHTEPLYERLLDELLEEKRSHTKKITVSLRVTVGARRAVRDILWPFSALVTEIHRKGETIIPRGDTELEAGDLLTVEGSPEEREEYLATLRTLVGEIVEIRESPNVYFKPHD